MDTRATSVGPQAAWNPKLLMLINAAAHNKCVLRCATHPVGSGRSGTPVLAPAPPPPPPPDVSTRGSWRGWGRSGSSSAFSTIAGEEGSCGRGQAGRGRDGAQQVRVYLRGVNGFGQGGVYVRG